MNQKPTPQIIASALAATVALKKQGLTNDEVAKRLGFGQSTLYRWRSLYGSMSERQIAELVALRQEKQQLQQALACKVAELRLAHSALAGNYLALP